MKPGRLAALHPLGTATSPARPRPPLSRRRARSAAATFGLALALALAATATATAQAAKPVQILSPSGAARAYGDLAVRVRTASPNPRLRVTMYGRGSRLRDVTARFRRAGTHVFVGKLRAGRELGVGDNSIYVQARAGRHGAASRHVLLARPASRALVLRRAEHGSSERPPLDVSVRATGGILRARLNGVDARRSFARGGTGRWDAHLSRKDGLRFGVNRLAVTVFDARGTYQRAERTFVVHRDRPLVDAGRDLVVREGGSIRLDAHLTRPAYRGFGLRLGWSIVRKPRGSHARLVGARTRHPRLVTDRRGRYRIALRAQHVPGGRGTVATAAGAPTAPTASTAPAATDTVDVTATPALPPAGAPLQTMVTQGGTVGISLDGQFYGMASGAVVQLLAIDRETLTVTADDSYAPGQEQQLLSDLDSLTATQGAANIVVLSGGGRGPYAASAEVQQAITSIGGTLDGESRVGVLGALTGGTGSWSVVGIPGIPQGQAYQLIGLQQGSSAPVGAMSGNLQLGSDGSHYAFTWAPEYHTFDTSQARTATSNAMTVDGATYTSWNLPFAGRQATTGYQLLWFDADTLTLRATATYGLELNPADPSSAMQGMLQQLRDTAADPKPGLLLVNTIGNVQTPYYTARAGSGNDCDGAGDCPSAGSDGNDADGVLMARVTTQLQRFGANPQVFIMAGSAHAGDPGTAGGYSLVGVSGLDRLRGPNAGAELSTRLSTGSIARLTGVLRRSRQGVLSASSTTSPGPTDDLTLTQPGLQRILGQPDQPFAPFETPGEQAAVAYIASQLGLRPDATYGIRGLYWQTPSADWDQLAGELAALKACTDDPCAGSYATVAQTLHQEFQSVYAVRSALTGDDDDGGLYQLFADTFITQGLFSFGEIAQTIRDYYDPPVSSIRGPNALGILSGTLGIVGGIGEFVPLAGEEVAAAAELGAGISDIVEASGADGETGESLFDPYGFRSTVAGLDSDLGTAFKATTAAIDQARDLIVSDAGRLSAAAALASTPSADGGWLLSSSAKHQIQTSLEQTTNQFMWLTMAQPVFASYECAAEDVGGVASHNPDAVLQTNVNFPALPSPDSRYVNSWWNLFPTSIVLGKRNHWGWPSPVTKQITDKLFGAGGVGLRREYVLAPANAAYAGSSSSEFDKPLTPTSHGLLRKNMNVWLKAQSEHGLSKRTYWSMYTPSCGWGQRLRWSDPDPAAPDSRDPVPSHPGGITPTAPDALWDPSANPYRNP